MRTRHQVRQLLFVCEVSAWPSPQSYSEWSASLRVHAMLCPMPVHSTCHAQRVWSATSTANLLTIASIDPHPVPHTPGVHVSQSRSRRNEGQASPSRLCRWGPELLQAGKDVLPPVLLYHVLRVLRDVAPHKLQAQDCVDAGPVLAMQQRANTSACLPLSAAAVQHEKQHGWRDHGGVRRAAMATNTPACSLVQHLNQQRPCNVKVGDTWWEDNQLRPSSMRCIVLHCASARYTTNCVQGQGSHLGVLLEHAVDQAPELRAVARCHGGVLAPQDAHYQGGQVLAVKRLLQGAQLVQHTAQRPHVALAVVGLVLADLRTAKAASKLLQSTLPVFQHRDPE
jgi:hypothetical protein